MRLPLSHAAQITPGSLPVGARSPDHRVGPSETQRALGQYFTPSWAALALVDRFLEDDPFARSPRARFWEPFAGPGRILGAIPSHLFAVGSELDPALAEDARRLTGRHVITGDARTVTLDFVPTHVITNPPFSTAVCDAVLDRLHPVLPEGGRVGMILPTSFFQTASRVTAYARQWGLSQEMIPRNMFTGLQSALCFAIFSKSRRRSLVGFALYRETDAIARFQKEYREILETTGGRATWRAAVAHAFDTLGGREADLQAIYAAVEGRRPTENRAWREQIRKVLQTHYRRVGPGRYQRPDALAA